MFDFTIASSLCIRFFFNFLELRYYEYVAERDRKSPYPMTAMTEAVQIVLNQTQVLAVDEKVSISGIQSIGSHEIGSESVDFWSLEKLICLESLEVKFV